MIYLITNSIYLLLIIDVLVIYYLFINEFFIIDLLFNYYLLCITKLLF